MIAFFVTAAALLVTAVMVVTSKDLVRAVLWLGLSLVVTAGAYAQLAADMLAAIQIMLYAGGVVTLMLFAVMLTPRPDDERPTVALVNPERGFAAALLMFFALAMALLQAELPGGTAVAVSDSQEVGRLFLTDHLLAFEALSVLLLAAMIAAIVIARRRDA